MKTRKIINKNIIGYTIIETMITVSLFLIVVVTGMGSFLNANLLHQRSQHMRSVVDSLSFIMEDMSRSLRTGYQYRCIVSGNINTGVPQSCELGYAIVFKPEDYNASTNPSQWAYKFESVPGGTLAIWKSTNSGVDWFQLNPSEVVIDTTSGFSVLGAKSRADGDDQQPFVIIRISGKILFKNTYTPFSLQTAVSQRAIDV